MPSRRVVYDIVAADHASKTFERIGAATHGMSLRMQLAGAAIGTALVGGVERSVKAAANYQSAITLLNTAGGETQKNLGKVSAGIQQIALSTGTSLQQLTEGMYTVEKAGIRGGKGLNVLRVSAQAAKAENVDLATMTNAVTSAMTSYHVPASQAVKITNQIVAAAGGAKTTMQDYAGALSTVLPIASAAGISFAQVGGAIATLTNHGTSAQEATQELANTIRNLQAPNSVAVNEMAQLGLTANNIAVNLGKRGLTGTLDLLSQTVLQQMGPSGLVLLKTFNQSRTAAQDAQKMLASLPPAAAKVAKSYADGSLSLKDYRLALKGLPGPQAALVSQFVVTENKSKGFNSALRSGVSGSQTYTDAIKKMTGGATGLNTTLQLTGENTQRFNDNVTTVAKAGKEAGRNISTWGRTQKTFNVQWDRFKELLQVVEIRVGSKLLGPLGSLVSFLNNKVGPAISGAASLISHMIGGAFDAIKPAASGLESFIAAEAPKVARAARPIGRALSGPIDAVKGAIKDASKYIGGFFAGMSRPLIPKHAVSVQDIVDVQTGITGNGPGQKAGLAVQNAFKGIGKRLNLGKLLDLKSINWGKIDTGKLGATLGHAIFNSLTWITEHTAEFTKKLFSIVGDLIKSVDWVGIGKQAGGAAIPFAIGFIENIFAPLVSPRFWMKHWLDVLLAAVSVVPIGKGATALAAKFGDTKFIGPVIKAIAALAGPMGRAVSKLFGFVGGAIGDGLRLAFSKTFPKAADWIAAHTGGYLSTALGVGKLRVAEIGRKIIDGLRVGIVRGSEALFSEIFSLTKDVVRPFGRAGSWLIGKGRDAISGLGSGIRTGWRPVGTFIGGIKGRVTGFFKGAGSWLFTLGQDIGNGLKAGMGKGIAGLAAVFLAPIHFIRDHILNPFLGAISHIPGVPDWRIGTHGGSSGPITAASGAGSRVVNPGGGAVARASGGPVAPGQMAWVGEQGKELMQALPGGGVMVYPHGASKRMEAGMGLPGFSVGGFFGAIKDAAAWTGGKVWSGAKAVGSGARQLGGIAVGALLRGAEKAASAAIGLVPGGDWAKGMAHGVMDTIVNSVEGWIRGKGHAAPSGAVGDTGARSGSAAVAQSYARSLLSTFGWAANQMTSLLKLWNQESGWNAYAVNPSSGAYGIPQALGHGNVYKLGDYKAQEQWGLRYIASRYGSPAVAWAHEVAHNWYAKGTRAAKRGLAVVGEKGAELIHLRGGEEIYNHGDTMRILGRGALPGYASGTTSLRSIARKYAGLLPSSNKDTNPFQVSEAYSAMLREIEQKFSNQAAAKIGGYLKTSYHTVISNLRSHMRTESRDYLNSFTSGLPQNAMKFQVQAVANRIKGQIGKVFSGERAKFLDDYINQAANLAIANSRKRMAKVGQSLLTNIVDNIDGGNALTAMQGRFQSIYDTVKAQFAGPREKSVLAYVRNFNDQLASLGRQRDRIANRIQAANQFAASATSSATGFADITGLGTATPAATVKQLEHKMRGIMNFNANLKALSRRGLSRQILDQLIAAGPEAGGAMAQQLVRAGGGQLNRLNYLEGRIQRASGRLGTTSVNISMGGNAAVDFVAGLQRRQGSLERLMDRLGQRLASSLGRSFGIKHFAAGGPMRAGQIGLVGENGPEFFVPSTSGRIVPIRPVGGEAVRIEVPVHIDKREVGRIVADYQLNKQRLAGVRG